MMATARRPLVAGNWKMNGLTTSLAELDRMIAAAPRLAPKVDLMVCPPATLMAACAARAAGSALAEVANKIGGTAFQIDITAAGTNAPIAIAAKAIGK